MEFLKNPLFWKVAFFLIVLGVALWIPAVDTEDVKGAGLFVNDEDIEKIEVTSGVRAAFYAMVAAAFVLVGLIPMEVKRTYSALFNLLVQVLGGGAAFFAGWLWLSSETGDMPLPYILPMAILGLVVGMSISIQVIWFVAESLLNRGGGNKPTVTQPRSPLPRWFYITHFFSMC